MDKELLVFQRQKDRRYVTVVISSELLAAPWPTFKWTHVVADDLTNGKG
jgi:hypothetical protein